MLLKESPIKKIGFDILTLIDMEDAEATMKELWYAEDTPDPGMGFDAYGTAIFRIMRPRPGALGLLRDLRTEGCRILFFTDITDDETGDRAEKWLQEWSTVTDLALHQIKTDAGQTPVQLDCQAYIVAEGHGYLIPADRPRVEEHPRGGKLKRSLIDKVRKS